MKRYILSRMKQNYISMGEELENEKKFYAEELEKSDWKYLKNAGEMFLIHAYSHRFHISQSAYKFAERIGGDPTHFEIFGDDEDKIRYSQFNLNLAVGLELILKSILLRKGIKINTPNKKGTRNTFDLEHTIPLSIIINKHLRSIFPNLIDDTMEEIKDTLRLINLRRNNIAHCSKKSYDSYAYEHRFSYVTLYIYESFFYGDNAELTQLLLKSIDRGKSMIAQSTDFKPLKIIPRSLRKIDFA